MILHWDHGDRPKCPAVLEEDEFWFVFFLFLSEWELKEFFICQV